MSLVARKRNGKQFHIHHEEMQFKPLTSSDIYVGKIPKSRRALATPSVKPSVSIKLIEAAADWIASERERLLKERRKRNGKKK
jgi:hypothetical protein